jgi:glycosyltransferase involved in cell wall biosynthesis
MKIGMDTFPIVKGYKRGIGNYALELYRQLFRMKREDTYFLLVWEPDFLSEVLGEYYAGHENIVCHMVKDYTPENMKDIIIAFTEEYSLDVFYTPSAAYGCPPNLKKECFPNTVLAGTVHDIWPWIMRDRFFHSEEVRREYVEKFRDMWEYDILFTISEYSKKDVEENFPVKRIVNIYEAAIAHEKMTPHAGHSGIGFSEERKWLADRDYLLCVAGFTINKCPVHLVRAYAKYCKKEPEAMPLIIVGKIPDNMKMDMIYFIHKNELKGKLFFTDYVSDEELAALYQHARWMVFPSYYEGFGLPVVEAWNYRVPVMTSDSTSLKEIAGSEENAILVDPYSVDSILQGLEKIHHMTDDERNIYIENGEKRAAFFSWEKTAQLFCDYLEDACKMN